MGAYIRFSGMDNDGVGIEEDAEEVARLATQTDEMIKLTSRGQTIYVNPNRIAYVKNRTKTTPEAHFR